MVGAKSTVAVGEFGAVGVDVIVCWVEVGIMVCGRVLVAVGSATFSVPERLPF